jgi:hypothetical protein
MKKLLTLALFSLAGLGWSTGQAPAWFCCHKCCNKCSTTLCCHPYNAFSPVCWGNITCCGCCPLQFGCCPPGLGPMTGGYGNGGFGGGGWGSSYDGFGGACDGTLGGCTSCPVDQLPALATPKSGATTASPSTPSTGAPTSQGPMPTQGPAGGATGLVPGPEAAPLNIPYPMLQPTGYESMAAPPAARMPQPGAMTPIGAAPQTFTNAFTATMPR